MIDKELLSYFASRGLISITDWMKLVSLKGEALEQFELDLLKRIKNEEDSINP